MNFHLEQRFSRPVDEVARAFADPGLYERFAELPKVSPPEVLDHQVDGDVVTLAIRYRFDGDLSSAVRRVVDPQRLTWVDTSRHDLARHEVTFTMRADHYDDRFRCSGSYRFGPAATGCLRVAEGSLTIKFPLVGRTVEGAIVSGLREHLAAEVGVVEGWLGEA